MTDQNGTIESHPLQQREEVEVEAVVAPTGGARPGESRAAGEAAP